MTNFLLKKYVWNTCTVPEYNELFTPHGDYKNSFTRILPVSVPVIAAYTPPCILCITIGSVRWKNYTFENIKFLYLSSFPLNIM